ncbi:hypothetical protein BK797_10355 [Kosakonia sacchari]|nr:hypothetical protein BK797_10355 [Kosakonia sacchari]
MVALLFYGLLAGFVFTNIGRVARTFISLVGLFARLAEEGGREKGEGKVEVLAECDVGRAGADVECSCWNDERWGSKGAAGKGLRG